MAKKKMQLQGDVYNEETPVVLEPDVYQEPDTSTETDVAEPDQEPDVTPEPDTAPEEAVVEEIAPAMNVVVRDSLSFITNENKGIVLCSGR